MIHKPCQGLARGADPGYVAGARRRVVVGCAAGSAATH
jgi:hypothetical protein